MRRAALIAAVALGSGCMLEPSNLGGAVLYWSFWTTSSHGVIGAVAATATQVCGEAGVDEVRVTLTDPGGLATTHPRWCVTANDVPGVRFTGLEPGTWDYYVEGYRAGVRVFDDLGSFDVFQGSETVTDSHPGALYGDLELAFTVPGCAAGDRVEFDLMDTTWGLDFSTSAGTTNPPVAVACTGSSAAWTIPSVPPFVAGASSGSYELLNVVQTTPGGTVLRHASCIPHWIQPGGGTVIPVTIDAATAPVAPGGYCL